jgi:glutathione S-transferase
MKLYAHPFSSYCQKALTALYENDTPFEYRVLSQDDKETMAEFERLWPLQRFPVLVDRGQTIREASIIIEHLEIHHPGPVSLIPGDPDAALQVRFMDRFSTTTSQRLSRRSSSTASVRRRIRIATASSKRNGCWAPLTAGSTKQWRAGSGRQETLSASRTARLHRPCSTRTGPTLSIRRSRAFTLTAVAFFPAAHSAGQ